MDSDELQRLLAISGVRQDWLARRLGVAENTVSRWAQGRMGIPASRDAAIVALLSPQCPVCGADRG